MSFFQKTITKESIDDIFKEIYEIISKKPNEDKSVLIQLLNSRKKEFDDEFIATPSDQLLLSQYRHFAKAINNCLRHPFQASSYIDHYLTRFDYYPVHITNVEKPNPFTRNLVIGAVSLGVALLLGAIPAFVFNPVIGAVLIAAAITCLLPSALYYFAPDSLDTTAKKEEERIILESAARLIDPTVQFESKPQAVNIPMQEMFTLL